MRGPAAMPLAPLDPTRKAMLKRTEHKRRAAAELVRQLERTLGLHRSRLAEDPASAADRLRLVEWQSARLRCTYSDLVTQPRYVKAVAFFLEDIYGTKDFSKRDHDLERISPIMVRMLPPQVIDAVAKAMELNALSQELDNSLLTELRPIPANGIREDDYAAAYLRCDNHSLRVVQIRLIGVLGRELDALVQKRFVAGTLHMMRRPAELAGFGEMQAFLESGFDAFRALNGAAHFLDTVMRRERSILDRIYRGEPNPFDLGVQPLP